MSHDEVCSYHYRGISRAWLTAVTVWLYPREGVAKCPCKCGSKDGIYIRFTIERNHRRGSKRYHRLPVIFSCPTLNPYGIMRKITKRSPLRQPVIPSVLLRILPLSKRNPGSRPDHPPLPATINHRRFSAPK